MTVIFFKALKVDCFSSKSRVRLIWKNRGVSDIIRYIRPLSRYIIIFAKISSDICVPGAFETKIQPGRYLLTRGRRYVLISD